MQMPLCRALYLPAVQLRHSVCDSANADPGGQLNSTSGFLSSSLKSCEAVRSLLCGSCNTLVPQRVTTEYSKQARLNLLQKVSTYLYLLKQNARISNGRWRADVKADSIAEITATLDVVKLVVE